MKTFSSASRVSSLAFAALLFVSACNKADQAKPSSEPVAQAEGGHAPKDVVPGSHEDWCVEHDVPESQCTKCDPSLAAAFKATGDWCDEHGLPKSHDRKHYPDLKLERPAKK